MDLKLKDKRVLVSGSTSGIGYAIGSFFLSEGAKVVFTGRDSQKLREVATSHESESALFIECDFEDSQKIVAVRNEIQRQWKGLDILICNVGSGRSTLEPAPALEQVEKIFRTNFYSATETTHHFVDMISRSQGNIIYITSIAGHEPIGAPVDYSAAKCALGMYAKSLAKRLGPAGVRVNCVAPGNIYFPGGTWARKLEDDRDKVTEMLATKVPLGRMGDPLEVAAAVAFLASSFSAFTTGATFVVDGGQSSTFL
ncbi:MAG: SDR family NAD(P)-dependent oxidoreductase [Oligoflexales bacterium]